MNQHLKRLLQGATVRGLVVSLCAWSTLVASRAQDLPRPSLSRVRDATNSFQRPYNLKLGPVALSTAAGLGVEFIDNLNLSVENQEGDIVFRPSLSLSAVWQVTRLNNLEFRTTLGYTKFQSNPQLDSQSLLISPDTALRFNVFIGDVKLIFSEQFSFEDDPIGAGAIANVATLTRFTNTLGVTALWDLNDVIWSVSYRHASFITTGRARSTEADLSNNLSLLDRTINQATSSVFLKVAPTIGIGLEGTAAYTKFPKNENGDATNYSLGPFIDIQLTRYTRMILSGGYQLYENQNFGAGVDGTQFGAPLAGVPGVPGFGLQLPQSTERRSTDSDGSGYYVTLAVTHRLNRFYSDQLTLGREFQLGLLSDRVINTFVNYSSTWQLTRLFTLSTAVAYQRSEQTSQFSRSFNGATLPNFDNLSLSVSTGYQITRKLGVSLNYQFVKRMGDSSDFDFSQNRLALQFGYQF